MSEQIHIPGLFRTIVQRVSDALLTDVYFDYGVYDTVAKNLISKDNSINQKDRKYPLVWLVTPIREDKPIGSEYASEISDVSILILTGGDNEATSDQRDAVTFEPVLRPIYRELLKQIDESCFFSVLSPNAIDHEVKEWPYHSGPETVSGKYNLFNDYIDCIQIRRLRLNVNRTIPNSFKLLIS